MITFPVEGLDLTKYVLGKQPNEEYIYNLIAVSNHYGGMGGGHYTSYAKNCILNKWLEFDDS